MLKMLRVATTLLLCAWFCEACVYNPSIHDILIERIFGIGPFNVLESTENPSTSIVDANDSCICPDEVSAVGVQNCVCVPYHNCQNNFVDRYGRNNIEIKIDEDSPCLLFMHWCCSLDNITHASTPPTVQKLVGCGWRKPDGVGVNLISNSDMAQFGEFPWMVALLSYTEDSAPSYICGGALIHPQAVITAAHCVFNKTKYLIRAGEWDSRNKQELYPLQDRKVKSVVIHPNFSKWFLSNNIAFLLLESPVDMVNPNVGLACLPQQGERFSDGTECFATGWGKDKFGQEEQYKSILKKIKLPIVETKACEEKLRKTELGKYFDLDTSFICAQGEPRKDTCQGDGGSPLVCPIPGNTNRYKQAGIASGGMGCGVVGVPGVYANVALFRDWIDRQAILNNLDTSTYTFH